MRCVFLDEHYHSVNGRDIFLVILNDFSYSIE